MKYIKKGQKVTIEIDQTELYLILSHVLWGIRETEINEFNCSDIARNSAEDIFEIADNDPEIFGCKNVEFNSKDGVIYHKEENSSDGVNIFDEEADPFDTEDLLEDEF